MSTRGRPACPVDVVPAVQERTKGLLAADVVTADGEIVRADADSHPDLFWGIRGGGGNLGVVTRFRYRLHEVGTIAGGMLILPASPGAIESFAAEADAAPEELSLIAAVMPAPPMPFIPEEVHGSLVILGLLAYPGDVEAGDRAVAPFRKLAEPLADMVRPIPYPEIYLPDDEDYHPIAASRTMFLRRDRPRRGRVGRGRGRARAVGRAGRIGDSPRGAGSLLGVHGGRERGGPGRRVPGCDVGPAGRDQGPVRSEQPLPPQPQRPAAGRGGEWIAGHDPRPARSARSTARARSAREVTSTLRKMWLR
jgi:hypothetical protein